jgi:hypothetical protein
MGINGRSLSRYLDKVKNIIFNIKMQVTYPSHHSWLKDITSGLAIDFSGRTAKKIHASLPKLADFGITYTIEPLSEAFLSEFMPLYTQEIGAKENALMQDIPGKTLYNTESSFPYFCLSLRENGLFIGGTIFSVRSDRISYAYRTFLNVWNAAPLKASPALIGEYAVAQFACDKKLSFLSHGKDRNPYGLNANIGLATFKLSVGCWPSVPPISEIKTIDTETITKDCLILELPESGKKITRAYLITSRETETKHIQVTKYPDLLQVEVLYRD